MKIMQITSFGVIGHSVMYNALDFSTAYDLLCLIRPFRAEIKLFFSAFLIPGWVNTLSYSTMRIGTWS